MKGSAPRGGRTLMVGYLLVLAMVLVLAFRTEQTVAAVLSGGQPPRIETKEESTAARVLAELGRRYEQIAQALPALRDPFRDPPAPPRPAVTQPVRPAQPAEPPAPVFPRIRAIVYDQHNPAVRLAVGDEVSNFLHQGDIFRGWKVDQITAQDVRVTRDGRSYQIPAY